MTPLHAVLDTSVAVSALVFHAGALSWLRGTWRSGSVCPLASRENTAELIRVLGCPRFALNAEDQRDLLDDYLPYCRTVVVPVPVPAIPECHDLFDRPFLELALAGRADALVTGDSDILELAGTLAVPILSPVEFRRRVLGRS